LSILTIEKKKKYTAADYMLLEEGAPFHLINYDLIMSPSPARLHQIITLRLIRPYFYNIKHGEKQEQ